jgi:hypothetical protein
MTSCSAVSHEKTRHRQFWRKNKKVSVLVFSLAGTGRVYNSDMIYEMSIFFFFTSAYPTFVECNFMQMFVVMHLIGRFG